MNVIYNPIFFNVALVVLYAVCIKVWKIYKVHFGFACPRMSLPQEIKNCKDWPHRSKNFGAETVVITTGTYTKYTLRLTICVRREERTALWLLTQCSWGTLAKGCTLYIWSSAFSVFIFTLLPHWCEMYQLFICCCLWHLHWERKCSEVHWLFLCRGQAGSKTSLQPQRGGIKSYWV